MTAQSEPLTTVFAPVDEAWAELTAHPANVDMAIAERYFRLGFEAQVHAVRCGIIADSDGDYRFGRPDAGAVFERVGGGSWVPQSIGPEEAEVLAEAFADLAHHLRSPEVQHARLMEALAAARTPGDVGATLVRFGVAFTEADQ